MAKSLRGFYDYSELLLSRPSSAVYARRTQSKHLGYRNSFLAFSRFIITSEIRYLDEYLALYVLLCSFIHLNRNIHQSVNTSS